MAIALLPIAAAPALISSIPRKCLFLSAVYPIVAYFLIWGGLGLEVIYSTLFGGLLLTFILAVIGIPTAIVSGVLLAIGRTYGILPVRAVCAGVIEFWRGIPLIVLLFAGVVSRAYILPPGVYLDLIFFSAIIISMPTSAQIAIEIGRALATFPQGRVDAARALGLDGTRTFLLVVLPQTIRAAGPKIALASASLFRNTTLVIVVGLLDPLSVFSLIRATRNWNGAIWEVYIPLILLYGAFSLAISGYAAYLDRKLKSENRPAFQADPVRDGACDDRSGREIAR